MKDLKAALNAADQESRIMAYEAIRELIDEVVIRPHRPYKPVEIDIYGRIQSLFPKNENGPESMGVLVAGLICFWLQPTLSSHGENRGSSPLGSASKINNLINLSGRHFQLIFNIRG